MDKTPLWTKSFILNCIVNFFVFAVYYLLMVIIAEYAMDQLQASPGFAGLLAGSFMVAGIIGRLLTGRLIERIGRKRLLWIGLAIYVISTLLYLAAGSLPVLFAVRILQGIGFGISSTSTSTIAAYLIPLSRRGEGISYFSTSITLSSAIGPFLGMLLYRQASFEIVLVLNCILIVLACVGAVFLKVPESSQTANEPLSIKSFSPDKFFESRAMPISIVGMLIFFCLSSILSFLSPYTASIGLTEADRKSVV